MLREILGLVILEKGICLLLYPPRRTKTPTENGIVPDRSVDVCHLLGLGNLSLSRLQTRLSEGSPTQQKRAIAFVNRANSPNTNNHVQNRKLYSGPKYVGLQS